jgi:hypothetical protein
MVLEPQLLDYLLLTKQLTKQLHKLLIQFQSLRLDLTTVIGSMSVLMFQVLLLK